MRTYEAVTSLFVCLKSFLLVSLWIAFTWCPSRCSSPSNSCTSRTAPAGGGEPFEPHDGELHAVHLEDATARSQTWRQQAPWPWSDLRPGPEASFGVGHIHLKQPLHCRKPLGGSSRGKVWPGGTERGKVPRIIEGPAAPSPPQEQDVWPPGRPFTAATHLQNGFMSHLRGPWSVGQRQRWKRCHIGGWICFHHKVIPAASLEPHCRGRRRALRQSFTHASATPWKIKREERQRRRSYRESGVNGTAAHGEGHVPDGCSRDRWVLLWRRAERFRHALWPT